MYDPRDKKLREEDAAHLRRLQEVIERYQHTLPEAFLGEIALEVKGHRERVERIFRGRPQKWWFE